MKKTKKLKRTYKKFRFSDCLAYLFEIWKSPPRACAVVSMALLDKLLLDVLKSGLVPVSKSQDTLSAISVDAKINLIYRLGIIDKDHYKVFCHVNGIRNAFAHEVEVSTFDHELVRYKMEKIKSLSPIKKWFEIFEFENARRTLKEEFKAIVQYLIRFLLTIDVKGIEVKHGDVYSFLNWVENRQQTITTPGSVKNNRKV